ncbi:MAG: septum formation initiator family protein [Alphaproteobacteria bacterium]
MKLRWHLYILPLTFLVITFYFTFHLVQGERGVFRLFEVNREIAKGEKLLAKTQQEKNRLEKRINALQDENIDADMLDEVARMQFGVLLPEEYVIFE